jgi:ABC-type dipeptide/oligopeptide/nickel transport system permease subunit/outer membrane protein assembly factor BamB
MSADLLINAQKAIDRGDKVQARLLLRELILQDPGNEQAWLLLARVVEKRNQTIDCLERAYQINPKNHSVQLALSMLRTEIDSLSADDYQYTGPTGEAPLKSGIIEPAVQSFPSSSIDSEASHQKRRISVNWPFMIGALIVLAIIFLAIIGPHLAQSDPLEITALIKVGDKYATPPYPLLSPGFPLGSDGEGRDLLSRMLWAIRPTMILVLVVASVRLLLGTLIGLTAGWSTSWLGRALDGVIAVAISIPVIIVALGGIAAVGVDLGIWAFIIALSLTGWVETARVVREQTQVLRNQVYIEAAHSLGGTNTQILRWHILRQVLSLLWMLFAFEISSTLLLVAALGFLGYYIGGDVWISVTDATAVAISGMPELGQMLATTPLSINRPWPLLIIGALVFVIVLGFNLLGEGLRRRHGVHAIRQRSALADWTTRAQLWADENLWWPLANFFSRRSVRLASLGIILIAVVIGVVIFQTQELRKMDDRQIVSAFTQKQMWATARHDPYGTNWSQAAGPELPEVNWNFFDEMGFTGGPVVSIDGTIYIASNGSSLYAIDPAGEVLWETELAHNPVGTPGLNADGKIYVSDQEGGLTKLNERGEADWYYQAELAAAATTGPVIDPDGNAYYIQGQQVQAVSAAGEALWLSQPNNDPSQNEMVRLNSAGDLLFWGEVVLRSEDGSIISTSLLPDANRFFTGADGLDYLVDGHEVRSWDNNLPDPILSEPISWEHQKYSISKTSRDAGVTPDGKVWLFYTSFARSWGLGEDTRIVWLDQDGKLSGNVFYEIRNSQVIGVDQKARIFTCGNLDLGYGKPECQAFSPEAEKPLWILKLEESSQVVGGALVPNRLYIATREGFLYAIGAGETRMSGEGIAEEIQPETSPMDKESVLASAGEPLGPKVPVPTKIFMDESGFSGGAIDTDGGALYIASLAGELYALDPQGVIAWQVTLHAGGIGNPAIGGQGEIFVVDKEGGLTAYSEHGEMIWHYRAEPDLGGIAGPVVSSGGEIYYTIGSPGTGIIQAVSGEGEALWQTPVETDLFYRSPDVNASGDLIFFRDEIFDAVDGSAIDLELPFDVDQFFSGEDGENYLLAEGTVAAWQYHSEQAVISEARVLSPRGKPVNLGVTAEGVVWMLYPVEVYWFTTDGQALGVSSLSQGWIEGVAEIDRDFTIYAYGRDDPRFKRARSSCFAFSLESSEPIWISIFSTSFEEIVGGLMAPGGIYILTEEGNLYLIEDGQ